jgi:hypothetical protein
VSQKIEAIPLLDSSRKKRWLIRFQSFGVGGDDRSVTEKLARVPSTFAASTV